MKFSLSVCFAIIAYAALVFTTLRFPTDNWEMLLNVLSPTTGVMAAVLAFHYRSTVWFAYSAAFYLCSHLCENYGGYLFQSIISRLLGDKDIYYADIAYNHICVLAGLFGMLVAKIFVEYEDRNREDVG